MATPRTLLRPTEVAVGDLVQARDPSGIWYNAKIIQKSGRGSSASATVHYIGFGKSEDEKFTASKEGLRVRLPAAALRAERQAKIDEDVVEYFGGRTDGRHDDGTWEIERILMCRMHRGKKQWLVRWQGWTSEHDSWEDKNLSDEIIEEYEEDQAAVAETKLHPPRKPFAVELAEAEDEAICELRIADAAELLVDIAKEVMDKMKHQLVPEAEKKLYVVKPVSAPIFYAIRATLARWAEEAQPTRPVETVVEMIKTHRGGKRPVNTFGVLDDVIVCVRAARLR